jgi:phosphoglycerol geranylgeranyltransferase
VGGGIRDASTAERAAQAGADIIVTGTLVEQVDQVKEKIHEIVEGIRKVRR